MLYHEYELGWLERVNILTRETTYVDDFRIEHPCIQDICIGLHTGHLFTKVTGRDSCWYQDELGQWMDEEEVPALHTESQLKWPLSRYAFGERRCSLQEFMEDQRSWD